MSRIMLLAWRYVTYYKVKTAILTVCVTLTILLPLTAHLLTTLYGESLLARAQATPLVVGARGNRFDLVLKALYFGAAHVDPIHMSEVERLRDDPDELGLPIPMHLSYTAHGRPVVGTTLEYFEFRGLHAARGTLPRRLGQAVLGSAVAAELGLQPGDTLFSDQRSLYDITRTYPLKMEIAGVLAETGTPDDQAVFVDIKTAWIIEGLVHGHQNVTAAGADESLILQRDENAVITNAAIVEYNEVTTANIASFHTHASSDQLPLAAIIVLPADRKAATLLKARYGASQTHQMVVPAQVVDELMGLVFRVKRFFDATFGLVAVSTALFLVLIVLLSLRIRRREMETMFKIGCRRLTVFWLQAAELGIVLALSVILSAALATMIVLAAPRVVRLL